MKETMNKNTRITVGDLELWTAPFGANKATITATEGGTKVLLMNLHRRLPEVFELMVDEADFCQDDMEGAFSVIVDPELVDLRVSLGDGKVSFAVRRECNEDCDNCEYNDCKDKEEANG